jgi:hypothetical protein
MQSAYINFTVIGYSILSKGKEDVQEGGEEEHSKLHMCVRQCLNYAPIYASSLLWRSQEAAGNS